jgi:hypothetical protein
MHSTVVLPDCESRCQAVFIDDLCDLLVHLGEMKGKLPEMIYGINPEELTWKVFYEKHAAAATLNEEWVRILPINEILNMIKVKGDVLMLPSFKRSMIDFIRNFYRALPFKLSDWAIVRKAMYNLKAMNYGLLNYDKYLKPPKKSPEAHFSSFRIRIKVIPE